MYPCHGLWLSFTCPSVPLIGLPRYFFPSQSSVHMLKPNVLMPKLTNPDKKGNKHYDISTLAKGNLHMDFQLFMKCTDLETRTWLDSWMLLNESC